MKMCRSILLVTAVFGLLPGHAEAQLLAGSMVPAGTVAVTVSTQPDLIYVRPTQKTKIRNYVFDTFGPYPIAGAAFAAGIGQAYNTPPEWRQGARGFIQAIWVELRHRGGNHYDALWVGTGLQGRHVVLPLRVQRIVSAAAPCRDLYLAARRG